MPPYWSVEGLLRHCSYFEGIFLLKIDLAASLSLIKVSCEYLHNRYELCTQCCGSGMFLPDTGTEFFHPDLVSIVSKLSET